MQTTTELRESLSVLRAKIVRAIYLRLKKTGKGRLNKEFDLCENGSSPTVTYNDNLGDSQRGEIQLAGINDDDEVYFLFVNGEHNLITDGFDFSSEHLMDILEALE